MSFFSKNKIEVPELPGFNAPKYMGCWYEIARLDHPFEKGLQRVTACYSLRYNGKISVLNRGYSPTQNKWEEARAVAVPTKIKNFLKVYFVPLFGGKYRVAYVDDGYSLAVVSGGNLRYLWLLARSPHPTSQQIAKMLEEAQKLGYDTSKLTYPEQE